MIRERSIAGQRAARERGRVPGRVRALAPGDERQVVQAYLRGDGSYESLGKRYGVSGSAVKRAVYRVTKSAEYVKRNKL